VERQTQKPRESEQTVDDGYRPSVIRTGSVYRVVGFRRGEMVAANGQAPAAGQMSV
jgi:hypothetical protein